MSLDGKPPVVIVPGLRDHMEEHWQTHLHNELSGSVCVPRMQERRLSCRAWVDALDAAIASVEGAPLLVAHSAGAMIVAHWAQRHRRPVHAALLVTPPDFETPLPEGYPEPHVLEENGWLPVPRERLPFPSTVAASTNDPLARFTRTLGLARSWGSKVIRLGNVGHLNPASGYGRWPMAHELVEQMSRVPQRA